MRNIVYYVASSLDGYIDGGNGDISKFQFSGKGVEKYQHDLLSFDTVIMGRKTYEFGYAYGLKPGEPAYPHMKHYIFSHKLKFEHQHENVFVEQLDVDKIKELKSGEGSDIYLCGGGEFAGWLLDHHLIDVLKIKLNPIILGKGTNMFGKSKSIADFTLISNEHFDDGLQIMTFKVNN